MLQIRALAARSALHNTTSRSAHHRSSPSSTPSSTTTCLNNPLSLSTVATKRFSRRLSSSTASTTRYSGSEMIRTSSSPLPAWSRRWYSQSAPEAPKESTESSAKQDDAPFATNNPKSRDEILREAKSFKKQYEEALAKQREGVEADERLTDKKSAFTGYTSANQGIKDILGMSPRQEGIPNPESLRSAQDLKIRRNTVVRKSIWSSFSQVFFDPRTWSYNWQHFRYWFIYAFLTAGLVGYVLISPGPEYDFFNKKQFEEEKKEEQERQAANQDAASQSSLISGVMDSTSDFVSNFSIIEPFRKLGYTIGGAVVAARLLHQLWTGDPSSEDERLIAAQTPLSLLQDLRPDEYHHISPLLKILATGHIPMEPWRALIPPSPWAPHMTLVIDTDLLYTVGFNDSGQRVMRRRPFADYLISALADNAEIILTSAHHSKTTGKIFFKLFDPHGLASHTFTAEDHRYDGVNWLKPLEERYIGRKPERLVVLDGNYWHSGNMRPNVLRVNFWQGNDSDTTLLELVPILKYMAAGIEEGLDTRLVISKYEGNSTAKDVIREQLSYTGADIPTDDPLTLRLKHKYAKEGAESVVLTDDDWVASMERLEGSRVVGSQLSS